MSILLFLYYFILFFKVNIFCNIYISFKREAGTLVEFSVLCCGQKLIKSTIYLVNSVLLEINEIKNLTKDLSIFDMQLNHVVVYYYLNTHYYETKNILNLIKMESY